MSHAAHGTMTLVQKSPNPSRTFTLSLSLSLSLFLALFSAGLRCTARCCMPQTSRSDSVAYRLQLLASPAQAKRPSCQSHCCTGLGTSITRSMANVHTSATCFPAIGQCNSNSRNNGTRPQGMKSFLHPNLRHIGGSSGSLPQGQPAHKHPSCRSSQLRLNLDVSSTKVGGAEALMSRSRQNLQLLPSAQLGRSFQTRFRV